MSFEFLIIGKFGKTHGLNGYIKVFPYSDDFAKFVKYDFFILKDDKYEPLKFSSAMNSNSKDFLLLNFADYPSINEASTLTNSYLYIRRADLPALPEGEFYFEALENMEVWLDVKKSITPIESEKDYLLLGVVEQVKKHFNQILLIVSPPQDGLLKQRLFIPFRYQDTILKVDEKENKIYTNWFVE